MIKKSFSALPDLSFPLVSSWVTWVNDLTCEDIYLPIYFQQLYHSVINKSLLILKCSINNFISSKGRLTAASSVSDHRLETSEEGGRCWLEPISQWLEVFKRSYRKLCHDSGCSLDHCCLRFFIHCFLEK